LNYIKDYTYRGWRTYLLASVAVLLLFIYSPLGWAATSPQKNAFAAIDWPLLTPSVTEAVSVPTHSSYIQWIPQQQVLQGNLQLQISTTLPVSNLAVSLSATVWQMVWDQSTGNYLELPHAAINAYSNEVLTAIGTPLNLPFTVQLPCEPGFWQVVFTVSLATPNCEVFTSERAYYVAYYPSASPMPGESFTVAVLPDTQYYARDNPVIFTRQTHWLAENAQHRNISLAVHMGDVTSRNTTDEWEVALASLGLLWDTVPFVLSVGNHDIIGPAGYVRQHTLIDNYFPTVTFPHLIGTFTPDEISNSYHVIQLAGVPYLVLALEFGPRDEVLTWAEQVISAHPHHKVIIITHTYTGPGGVRISATNSTASPQFYLPELANGSVNDGAQMWEKLIRQHANIQLVLSGHIGVSAITYNIARGDHGNLVYELLTNYQWEANGGNGYLALLQFTPAGELVVQVYSPFLDEYKASRAQPGFSNQFIINLESGKVKQLTPASFIN